MMRRPLLISASVVAVLSATLIPLALTVWSGSQERPSGEPAGPALDAANHAQATLAARLGLPVDAIAIDSVKAHTWQDASLGLPDPGIMYAQVVTDGYVVTLVADDTDYVYHVSGDVVKPNESGEPVSSVPTPQPAGPAGQARSTLAARLGVSTGEIAVVSVEEHTWSDASLGLPEPGMMYAQVLTGGSIVTLSHAGDTYVYHVAGDTVKPNPSGR